ncbi:MAG: hypothetical protein ACLVEU_10280 [Bacteroides cellulosilyticus]
MLYGTVGNQAIDPYSTLAGLGSYGYQFGEGGKGIYAYRPDKLVNKKLGWEITNTNNGRFRSLDCSTGFPGCAVELYDTRTKDLLMQRSIPLTTGFSRIWQNIGKTQNKGIELSLNGILVDTKEIQWDMNLNMSCQ